MPRGPAGASPDSEPKAQAARTVARTNGLVGACVDRRLARHRRPGAQFRDDFGRNSAMLVSAMFGRIWPILALSRSISGEFGQFWRETGPSRAKPVNSVRLWPTPGRFRAYSDNYGRISMPVGRIWQYRADNDRIRAAKSGQEFTKFAQIWPNCARITPALDYALAKCCPILAKHLGHTWPHVAKVCHK